MRKPKWRFRFNKVWRFQILPSVQYHSVLWKDKWGTPRCECTPSLYIDWLWFSFLATQENDEYWEQWLWIHKYCNGDEQKAKETWEWTDIGGKSTWKEFP